MNKTVKNVTKISLLASVFMILLWTILAAGSTLAWFSDTDERVNTFVFGDISLALDYKHFEDIDSYAAEWKPVGVSTTDIFDAEDLYEPGFTKVVFFRIRNTGDIAFDYKLAVQVKDTQIGYNVYGQSFYLPIYLRYGLVFGDTIDELKTNLSLRENARTYSYLEMGELWQLSQTNQLNMFPDEDFNSLEAGGTAYCAMIVYMPEEVGNVANYRGDKIPTVELGISALASQKGTFDQIVWSESAYIPNITPDSTPDSGED